MILKEALALVAAGVLLGAVALFFAVQFIRNMLFGVSAFDPASLALTMLLLAIVALAATLVPAREAMKLDPVAALRYE